MAIRSFADKATREFYLNGDCPAKWRAFISVANRKLDMIEQAEALAHLAVLPGNRLEQLKGNRKGQYSIRINQQYRICFRWTDRGAEDVEIVDYH
jgi:proteic killer suppression protein